MKKFRKWYKEAEKKVSEPNAFTLSTSLNNKPTSRMMLLKGIDKDLIFYTNNLSKKGKQIKINKYASMVFWWKELQRQVRIEGKLKELVSKYFKRGSFDIHVSFKIVNEKLEKIENKILIDKLPLSIIDIGLILRLFPNASNGCGVTPRFVRP